MQEGLKILLIEDDVKFTASVVELVGVYNDVTAVNSMAAAREALASQTFNVVLLDLTLPDGHGLPLIREIKSDSCTTVVLVLTGDDQHNTLKKCLEAGADDYVVKSNRIVPDLLVRIPVAVSRGAKDRHAASLESQLNRIFKQELVGRSLAMAQLRESVSTFATADSAILITGESGTGKENIARRLHHIKGSSRPFVAVNCGAIPENLIESHLFGHQKGSFTGAIQNANGYFAQAYGGDLFLDEIGELPLQAQAKLLRVLQDEVYFKVGGDHPIESKCRVIAATNVDLEELVAQKKFRKDLFYRLNILRIKTTPLRERPEDVPAIAQFIALKHCGQALTLSQGVLEALEKSDWPGNIRELENSILRAKHFAQRRKSKVIEAIDLIIDPPSDASVGLRQLESASPSEAALLSPGHFHDYLAMAEREYLRTALSLCGGQLEVVSQKLGIHRTTLFRKMKLLGLIPQTAPTKIKEVPAPRRLTSATTTFSEASQQQ